MAQLDLSTGQKVEKERNLVQDAVPWTYCTFEKDGKKFLQIDMYGRQGEDRRYKEKVTQVVQFDAVSAKALLRLFLETDLL